MFRPFWYFKVKGLFLINTPLKKFILKLQLRFVLDTNSGKNRLPIDKYTYTEIKNDLPLYYTDLQLYKDSAAYIALPTQDYKLVHVMLLIKTLL